MAITVEEVTSYRIGDRVFETRAEAEIHVAEREVMEAFGLDDLEDAPDYDDGSPEAQDAEAGQALEHVFWVLRSKTEGDLKVFLKYVEVVRTNLPIVQALAAERTAQAAE